MKNVRLLALATALVFAFVCPALAAVKDIQIKHAEGSYALEPAGYVDARSLAANTAESQTVPTFTAGGISQKASRVVFSATCDFYANYTTTATVPGDTTNGSASELNPTVRYLGGAVTTISVISATTCVVTMSFYR